MHYIPWSSVLIADHAKKWSVNRGNFCSWLTLFFRGSDFLGHFKRNKEAHRRAGSWSCNFHNLNERKNRARGRFAFVEPNPIVFSSDFLYSTGSTIPTYSAFHRTFVLIEADWSYKFAFLLFIVSFRVSACPIRYCMLLCEQRLILSAGLESVLVCTCVLSFFNLNA